MRTTHRRYWVFFLLFLFSGIAYLDRVNVSVAGKPIAQVVSQGWWEFGGGVIS
jgi:hypothetical protein